MSNSLPPPIIFFHKGYDPYIAFALWQARLTNPGSPIYVLGDDTNDLSFLGLQHVPYQDYPGHSKELISVYQHFSPHEVECERLCIERYFHIADFVKREKIGAFLYLDSDVLLLTNLAAQLPLWDTYDMAGVPGLYGTCYYKKPGLVDDFCQFILGRYRDPAQIASWRSAYENRQPGGPNHAVNDMVLSQLFLKNTSLRCLDLRVPRAGIAFNPNFWLSETEPLPLWRSPDGSRVYTRLKEEMAQLACLHFGGWSKRYASAFVDWSWLLVRCFFKPNYRRNFKKLIQYYYFGKRFRRSIPISGVRGGDSLSPQAYRAVPGKSCPRPEKL